MNRRTWTKLAFFAPGLFCSGGVASTRWDDAPAAELLSKSFRIAARRVLPMVVTVRSEAPSSPTPEESGPSRASTLAPPRGGSGFIIDAKRGFVLTNDHVIRDSTKATVVLSGGRERTVLSTRRDPKSDLAVVAIDPAGLPGSILWGDSERLDLGDWVLAIGQPFGLADTVTAGIVSGKGRGIGIALYEDLIQTDAAINPGNSGGPLVDLRGEVVGVNTAIKTMSGVYEGVGFAVPASRARRVAEDLVAFGRVRRAYLGLSVRRVDASEGERLEQTGAVVITSVSPEGPAADAGLRSGDIILRVGGREVAGAGHLQSTIETAAVGKPLQIEIERAAKRSTVVASPRSQPEQFGLSDP
ncbi:MAG: trypsin-like peptidase domain-containing protein [Isosphaeraceae bacterium]|nr:trypsin-like peptidase domain-containing protein [Isosphaeraceae bacterium]